MTNGEPILALDNVRIRHDERDNWTPNGVTLDVADGEVVLILGPSGSGKSTLALSLNGLIPHSISATIEGTVTCGGRLVADTGVAELSEQVAMVFQNPDAQIVTGTVLDEVCFGPENLRLGVDEVMHRAELALRHVGLWDRRTENPDRLSLGGRQRLAIACALAMRSRLLVLDEPTANLDPAGIDEVYQVLHALVSGEGEQVPHSIVLIEHNLDAAIDLVDRVVVLDEAGTLVLDGPVRPTLLDNLDQLVRMGVWLPVSTLAALRLHGCGIELDPLPLTPAELTRSVDALPRVPAVAARRNVDPVERPIQISVRELSVTRGRTPVLHGVNLDIRAQEFLAIVGTNGAGKTTLVQAIAGVVAPPRGAVRVGDLDPGRASVRELSSTIGFVFQNPEHQFITHTVFDELAHGLRIRGVDEQRVAARVDEMLDRFGLGDLRAVHPFLLSGGQKRRLSVGTALIAGAPILALDEPTFGQDRERAAELLGLLRELNDDGTTVLVVTHDMQLVADYASQVAVMQAGRLTAHGPTAQIIADADLMIAAGLRLPPLATAMRNLVNHPQWHGITRLQDLPGA
ncbi:ABC transporter ATP-binding protein [Homoserinimonas sp. OAct 916]|uniref:ABC transporter ATP-binding protein n=1 Tax=Homoserinimonas sp. OAct 916 TaxID=2211450 RepID=UPI000DBE5CCC|nr:ATP-binding cassette domain-containing protein [Homoserinimonas sp. OAct 916]